MCRLLLLLPLVLLQACAGNPLAEQLERSFGAVETDPTSAVPADQGNDASTSGSTPTPAAETTKDKITRDVNANNSPQDSPAKDSPSKDIAAEGKAKTEPAKARLPACMLDPPRTKGLVATLCAERNPLSTRVLSEVSCSASSDGTPEPVFRNARTSSSRTFTIPAFVLVSPPVAFVT